MPINVEMCKRIEEIIIAHPEQHDQGHFELLPGECGTTRCVAGWAIHLWGLDNGVTGALNEVSNAYLDRVGVDTIIEDQKIDVPEYVGEMGLRFMVDADHVGAHILGLTMNQRYDLFFNMDNDDALRMVKEYAQGSTDVRRKEK